MTKVSKDEVAQDEKVDGEYGRIAEIARLLKDDSLEDILIAILVLSLQGREWTEKDLDLLSGDDVMERAYIVKSLMVGSYV